MPVIEFLSSRAELGEVRHELGEVQAALEDLRRNAAGTAAANHVELEVELEAGEVRRRVAVADLAAVDDGLRIELHLSRDQVSALQSDLKGIWSKHNDACTVLKAEKTKMESINRQLEADGSVLWSRNKRLSLKLTSLQMWFGFNL